MKSFAIIGAGRFGSSLAVALAKNGNEVLVIDSKAEEIQRISDSVTHAIIGDARDENVLKAVDINQVDCAVVSFSDNIESSVLITLNLKELGVKYVVSKAQSEVHAKLLEKIGADKIVFPERDMGAKLAQSLTMTNILDFIELSAHHSIVEMLVPKEWVGKTLRELNVRATYRMNILAIRDTHTHVVSVTINPDEPLKEGDILVIFGSNDSIAKLSKRGN